MKTKVLFAELDILEQSGASEATAVVDHVTSVIHSWEHENVPDSDAADEFLAGKEEVPQELLDLLSESLEEVHGFVTVVQNLIKMEAK